MFMLTQTDRLDNSLVKNIYIRAPKKEQELLIAGHLRYDRVYQVSERGKEYIIRCPEFRCGDKGGEAIVIIPEYLLPSRPYPVYIYLYAIDLYSRNPKMGQREAAKRTQKEFGLATFAHTTLGRALKKIIQINGDILKEPSISDLDQQEKHKAESPLPDIEKVKNIGEEAGQIKRFGLPSVIDTTENRRLALLLLKGSEISKHGKQQAIERSLKLVRERFLLDCRILL